MKAQKLSTRVEDGVCKSIPCSKIQAFSHKNMKKEVHLAERHLRVAREIVEKLGLRDKALVPLGHLDARVVLHHSSKCVCLHVGLLFRCRRCGCGFR